MGAGNEAAVELAAAQRHDERGAGRAVLAVVVTAAGGYLLGLPWWVTGLCAVYVASVASSAETMRAAYAAWEDQSRQWSELLVDGELGQELHDMAGRVRPPVQHAIDVLERHDPRAGGDARRRLEVTRDRTTLRLEHWRTKRESWVLEAMNEGYLGGRRLSPLGGSRVLVRYFAVYENTPTWLPRAVRRCAVPLLRIVDVVRLLHNDAIERRALIATLWVRAAVVAIAPLTAGASLTGVVPLAGGGSALSICAYAAVLVASLLAALFGPRLSAYTVHQETRWWLYAAEQSLTIAAVVAAPCWAVAVYGAGAVNWLQRPNWTLRRLLAWMALTYVPFAIAAAASGAEPWRIAGEAAIAIAATAIMACSYGLMAPVTATTLVSALVDSVAWRLRVWKVIRVERRELRQLIADLELGLRAHAEHSAEAADAAARLRAACNLLAATRVTLRRRPRRLDRLLSAAIARVVVPSDAPLPDDVPEPQLRASPVVLQPSSLIRLTVQSGGNARRLDALVRRIAQEAVDKGAEGLLDTYVRAAPDGGVEIELANAVPERPISGFGTGAQWLERDRLAIPDAHIDSRGRWSSDHPDLVGDVYSVVVRLGRTMFEREL